MDEGFAVIDAALEITDRSQRELIETEAPTHGDHIRNERAPPASLDPLDRRQAFRPHRRSLG